MVKTGIFVVAIFCFAGISFGQLTNPVQPVTSKNIILGFRDTIKSTILAETRVLNIYLPEEYSPDSAINYPVIYLLDGGIEEDFIHIVGLVRYFTTPWVDQFSKSIVVGITNVDRRRDFTSATANLDFVSKMGFDKSAFENHHGGSQNFISFIEKELQPYIQTHFKTNDSKTIIGESLGGLLATEVLLKRPALFTTYIIASPSLWWNGGYLLRETAELSKKTFPGKLKVYIGAANKDEDLAMFEDVQRLAILLEKYNHNNVVVYFDHLLHESHATVMHQAVYNAFKILYPKK